MLINRLIFPFLLLAYTACSADTSTPDNVADVSAVKNTTFTAPTADCTIKETDIRAIKVPKGARLEDQQAGINKDSQEPTLSQTFAFNNGDIAVVEQK